MRYLLDTVVVSEYIRKKPAVAVIEWLDNQAEQSLYISHLTIAELKKGYFKLVYRDTKSADKGKARKIEAWISTLETRFSERLLSVDSEVLDVWSSLTGKAEAEGRKLPVFDSLLTATAERHNLVVVTRNEADFKNCLSTIKLYSPY